MSSIPQSKDELYLAIKLAFTKLHDDYLAISDESSRIIAIEGNVKGTQVSVCDTLAYLIGWGRLVLKWHNKKSTGQMLDMPETGFKWNELGQLAQHFQLQFQAWQYQELLAEFSLVTEQILLLIESLSEQELYGEAWYKNYTLGRMVQFNTSSPMKNVRTKIRKFKRSNG